MEEGFVDNLRGGDAGSAGQGVDEGGDVLGMRRPREETKAFPVGREKESVRTVANTMEWSANGEKISRWVHDAGSQYDK